MLVKYPFFGSIVANVDYKENRKMDTAGTDGQTIYYNPDFLKKLQSDEQIFIFAHEVCHIAFDHIRRSEGKDPDIWNIATDGVINQFLNNYMINYFNKRSKIKNKMNKTISKIKKIHHLLSKNNKVKDTVRKLKTKSNQIHNKKNKAHHLLNKIKVL